MKRYYLYVRVECGMLGSMHPQHFLFRYSQTVRVCFRYSSSSYIFPHCLTSRSTSNSGILLHIIQHIDACRAPLMSIPNDSERMLLVERTSINHLLKFFRRRQWLSLYGFPRWMEAKNVYQFNLFNFIGIFLCHLSYFTFAIFSFSLRECELNDQKGEEDATIASFDRVF